MVLIKLREAVQLLEENGILGAETKQKEQAVKRLLNQGLILGQKPPKNQPKIGWQVDLDSLNEYIQIGNLKKSDMVKELIELRRKVRELEFHRVQTTDDIPLEDAIRSVEGTSSATHVSEVQQEEKTEKTEKTEKEKPSESIVEVPKEHEFTVSKLVVLERKNSKTYKVEFLLNKEHFEGIVSTEYNVQFVEIASETKKYVLGESEEQSMYLEALARKMSANIVRKLKAFDKKNE